MRLLNLLFGLFTGLVVLAPLPFGLVHELGQALWACLILAVTAAVALRQVFDAGPRVRSFRLTPEVVGFFAVLGWAVLQITSWSPPTWQHPLWGDVGSVVAREVSGSISLARRAGVESLLRLITYGAVFWLALQFGRERVRARRLLSAVWLAGVGYGVYGLVMYFSGTGRVLWVDVASAARSLSGPFVNRNNFATYLGLCLIGGAAFYLSFFLNALNTPRFGRDRRLHILQQALVAGAPTLAGLLILLTALFLTHSRGGVVSTLAALLVMLLLTGPVRRATQYRRYQIPLVMLIGVLLAVFLLSGSLWLERLLATDLERDRRILQYEQTLAAIGQSPWLGYGLGSFEQTFPMFADEQTANTDKAHNDWLELVFELGVPVAAVWFGVLISLSLRCLVGFFRRRRDSMLPLVGFCAGVLVALHAAVDFSLQVPGVAVTYAVMLGVGVAQSWSSQTDKGVSSAAQALN